MKIALPCSLNKRCLTWGVFGSASDLDHLKLQAGQRTDEPARHGDVGDVHRPDLVGPHRELAQKVWVDLLAWCRFRGVRLPIQGFDAHLLHQRANVKPTGGEDLLPQRDIELVRDTASAQVSGFGVFPRSLIGLDRRTVQKHFADFIFDGKSADQIEFVGMVIEQLTRNGVVDPGLLYKSLFTDRSPDGPDGVFDQAEIGDFFERLRWLNQTASVADTSRPAE